MAVTKIKPIKSTLKKALDYITNPEKTDNKMLVSSYGCSPETADIEFDFTLSNCIDKGNNLAHHLIQAFEPGETTAEQAHEIGKQLAEKVLNGQHEYVLTTHIDKGHIHNHIIFCAANFVDHKKYNSNRQTYKHIREISDNLCRENGLSVTVPKNKGKNYAEWLSDKAGTSWKGQLKIAVNTIISQSSDFEDFLCRMQDIGYEIKHGKYISLRAKGQERFTRLKTLGIYFAENAIVERIKNKRPRTNKLFHDDKRINLIIDIQNSINKSKSFEHNAKLYNLKQAAKALNFMTENNIIYYDELETKIDEIVTEQEKTATTLKELENRLTEMALQIKNISTYKKTKPIYDGYKTAKNKAEYRTRHQSSIIIHEAAVNTLKVLIKGNKLTNLEKLQADFNKFTEEKDRLYSKYNKIKKQLKQYDTVKTNIDSYLKSPENRVEKSKGHEI